MSGLYVSYRQSDSPYAAHALHARMAEAFGENRVFRASITGLDTRQDRSRFDDVVARNLVTACAMVAVIGPGWLATDREGRSRLHQPDDYVRLELATALDRDIPIVPVFVSGASALPDADRLPDALQPLCALEGIRLGEDRFDIGAKAVAARLLGAMADGAAGPVAEDLLAPGLGFTPVKLASGATVGGFEALRLKTQYDQVKSSLAGTRAATRCGHTDRAYKDALAPIIDNGRFQMAPNLSPTLERQARQACKLKPFQPIIAAVDLSFMRWGRSGLVLTERGLFHFGDREPTSFFSNAALARGPIDYAGGQYICIGAEVVPIPSRLDTARILSFVQAAGQVAATMPAGADLV